MRRVLVVLVAFASLLLSGCGDSTASVEAGVPDPASQEQGLCVMTAVCEGGQTVSCYGNPCSGTDYVGVTCDGVFTPCPTTSSCASGLPPCESLQATSCSRLGATQACCDGGIDSSCTCRSSSTGSRLWICLG